MGWIELYATVRFGRSAPCRLTYSTSPRCLPWRARSSHTLEFLRVSSLAVGVYVLEAGTTDHQIPHGEDEVYYVASGRAKMRTGSDENIRSFEVGPGTIIFVPARLHHVFYDIGERLSVLVFFAAVRSSVKVP
jgi:mannose-6-phosphate isomerase-like protein (cupin superfamily)